MSTILLVNPENDAGDQHISQVSLAFNKMYEEQRQNLVRLLRQAPVVVEAIRKLRDLASGDKYRVVIPPDIIQRLKDGTAHLGESASGGWSANIHDSQTGKIIGQVSLAEASPELLSSLSQMAIQNTLAEIAQRLEVIEQEVARILQGQIDDRKGLVDSGENLYVLASVAIDAENRRLLLINAVSQLSEARGRLIRALETNFKAIDKIPTDKWEIIRSSLFRDIPKDVQQKADALESTLRDVLRASCILALSCGELNEPLLLRESWQPLERLIPQLRTAQEKIMRWLPGNSHFLPDKFSTLLSVTDGVIRVGKQLESGQLKTLAIEFLSDEIVKGETQC